MTQYTLWQKLDQVITDSFIADVKEGKVPELPYHIINQSNAKVRITEKINAIKGKRFQTSILVANYGNGKTNIIKYLKLFYKQNKNAKIDVVIYPADPDNFDIITNLLKFIEDNFIEVLVESIQNLISSGYDFKELANDFDDNFGSIKEYSGKLFAANDAVKIKNLVLLGTGRLSSKRYFDKENIRHLKDYERRTILVLFLNIIAKADKHIIFCIDEVERISDKSKMRFSQFLTSLRELIDLSNKIHGHYLILAMTDKSDSNMIQATNEALFSRIHNDIIPIHPITEKEDRLELINYLIELYEIDNISAEEVLAKVLKEVNIESNRKLIQNISKILYKKESALGLFDLLEKHRLLELFNETKTELSINIEAFKNIHRKFFDPLEYYLESFNIQLNDGDNEQFKSQLRYYFNFDTGTFNYFIFNEDVSLFQNESIKIRNLVDVIQLNKKNVINKISIFVPTKMELNYSKINNSTLLSDYKVNIVDIDSYEDLFTLLELYRTHFEFQTELKEIIENYTNSSL